MPTTAPIMKDRTACIVDEHTRASEYEDDPMECGEFLDVMKMTKELGSGEVNFYLMAERILSLLGRTEALANAEVDDLSSSDGEDDDDDEDAADNDVHHRDATMDNTRVEWSKPVEHNLLLAGYTDCMDEAIRYLVEEEQYTEEHPIVEGLKLHLASQQERVLGEAARDSTNNQTDANNRPVPAQRVDGCAIRPPSI